MTAWLYDKGVFAPMDDPKLTPVITAALHSRGAARIEGYGDPFLVGDPLYGVGVVFYCRLVQEPAANASFAAPGLVTLPPYPYLAQVAFGEQQREAIYITDLPSLLALIRELHVLAQLHPWIEQSKMTHQKDGTAGG